MKNIVIMLKSNRFLLNVPWPIIYLKRVFNKRNEKHFDFLFSNVISSNIMVNLNNIVGSFYMNTSSHIFKRVLLLKEYETEIVDLINKSTPKNLDAINVGANIGLYTTLLAGIVDSKSKVLAIEPTPNAMNLLLKNIDLNGVKTKVLTFQGVATDSIGACKINTISGKEEYSSLEKISHYAVSEESFESIDADGSTIDYLVEINNLKPGIIVIDVEGAEYQVLRGASSVLSKYKPMIIIELADELLNNFGVDSRTVVTYLENLGYHVTDINNNKVVYPFAGNIFARFS